MLHGLKICIIKLWTVQSFHLKDSMTWEGSRIRYWKLHSITDFKCTIQVRKHISVSQCSHSQDLVGICKNNISVWNIFCWYFVSINSRAIKPHNPFRAMRLEQKQQNTRRTIFPWPWKRMRHLAPKSYAPNRKNSVCNNSMLMPSSIMDFVSMNYPNLPVERQQFESWKLKDLR